MQRDGQGAIHGGHGGKHCVKFQGIERGTDQKDRDEQTHIADTTRDKFFMGRQYGGWTLTVTAPMFKVDGISRIGRPTA